MKMLSQNANRRPIVTSVFGMGNASTSKRNLSRGVRGKQMKKNDALMMKKKTIASGLVHEYHE